MASSCCLSGVPMSHAYATGSAELAARFEVALQELIMRLTAQHLPMDSATARGLPSGTTNSKRSDPAQRISFSARSVIQELQDVLSSARPCACCSHLDQISQAGLYLLRLTCLLEQRLSRQDDWEVSDNMSFVTPQEGEMPHVPGADAKVSATEPCSSVPMLHCSGRRYAAPARPASSSPCSTPISTALFTPRASPPPRDKPSSPIFIHFHAELTLGLHQGMLRSLHRLGNVVSLTGEAHEAPHNALTGSQAAELQRYFIDEIIITIKGAQQHWSLTHATSGLGEVAEELSAVMTRLSAAIEEPSGGSRSPFLRVVELTSHSRIPRNPPPFISESSASHTPCASENSSTRAREPSAVLSDHYRSRIEGCLGMVGLNYTAKLVAQHLWCAEELLSQRFPAYTDGWGLLERARLFVDSARSPSPTTPHNDSAYHEDIRTSSISTDISTPSLPPSTLESSLARFSQHDGSSSPPCVTETQRKSERPRDEKPFLASPLRELQFLGDVDVPGGETVATAVNATASSSQLRTTTPEIIRAPVSSRTVLIPVARCAVWDTFLAAHSISPAATVLAIQQLSSSEAPSQPLAAVQDLTTPGIGGQSTLRLIPVNQPEARTRLKIRNHH